MRQAAIWFKYYRDEGRFQKLIWFVAGSGAIAFAEWSLSPGIADQWMSRIGFSDTGYMGVLLALSAAWIVIVRVGFSCCGWPALVMLIPIKWGLYGFYFIGMLYVGCAYYDACL